MRPAVVATWPPTGISRPYYLDDSVCIIHGDCREILPKLDLVDVIVTDPPYGLSLIGERHVGQAGCGVRRLDFFPNDTIEDGLAHVDTILEAVSLLRPHGRSRLSAVRRKRYRSSCPPSLGPRKKKTCFRALPTLASSVPRCSGRHEGP